MNSLSVVLPKSREALQELVLQKEKQIEELEAKVRWFEEQFRLAQQKRYGASSERTSETLQGRLFNEAETEVDAAPKGAIEEAEQQTETITYTRQKTGRKPVPKDLPVERREYRLTDEERRCPCCGEMRHEMSREMRRELEVIPAQVKIIEHVRYVYGCRQCEKTGIEVPIQVAPAPRPVIAKSLASPSALAHVIEMKYSEGVPLYRQQRYWERKGIYLPRAVLANWMIKAAAWLELIYSQLQVEIRQREILHADETPLQVLQEPGRAAEQTSYMWLYRTGREGPPIVLYDYECTRAGMHPRRFLQGFQGILLVDGYGGYEPLEQEGIQLAGCWAHARRKFDEAIKVLPKAHQKQPTQAHYGMQLINQLYGLEHTFKDCSNQERYQLRQTKSRPLVETIKGWLEELAGSCLPKGKLNQAIQYCLNQWPKLIRFLEDGRLEIDNNRAERSIKPFVMGRKNWLFCNTPSGARASAVLYSIWETAKENGLNPTDYLTQLFQQLPNMGTADAQKLQPLLPWNIDLPRKSPKNQSI